MIGDRVVRLFCANASDSTPLVRLFSPLVDPKDWGVYVKISTSLPEHAYSVRGRGAAPEHYTSRRRTERNSRGGKPAHTEIGTADSAPPIRAPTPKNRSDRRWRDVPARRYNGTHSHGARVSSIEWK